MKLCFFGDSIGKGIVYDKERGRYVPTENSFVRLVGEEEKIDIENFSRFGCTVTRGEQIVERNVPEIKSSDYVVLEFGGNDSDYNWKKIADDPDAEHSPNTPLSVFVETYKKVIGEIKKLGKIPVILNLPDGIKAASHRFMRCRLFCFTAYRGTRRAWRSVRSCSRRRIFPVSSAGSNEERLR